MATSIEEYETDAQPIPAVHCPTSPAKPDGDNLQSRKLLDEDENDEVIDCDRLVDNANKSPDTTGEFIVSGSAVEIANSSSVHFGHKITQKTDISFEKATSVVVDRRQWNYITYPNQVNFVFILILRQILNEFYFLNLQSTFPRSTSCNFPIIEVVQEFNRHRYRYRLAHGFTPLPWCTRFSPHLDNSMRFV